MSSKKSMKDLLDKFIIPDKLINIGGVDVLLRGLSRPQITKLETLKLETYSSPAEQMQGSIRYAEFVVRSLIKEVKNLELDGEDFELEFIDEKKTMITQDCLQVLDVVFTNVLKVPNWVEVLVEHYSYCTSYVPEGVRLKEQDKKKE